MKTAATLLAVGALALVNAACGAGQAGVEGPEPGLAREVSIEVENQNFNDARIYLVEYGRRTRLGDVPGNTTRVFRFRSVPQQVRFRIHFIGGGELTTDGVEVSPGDELVLIVTPTAHRLRLRG